MGDFRSGERVGRQKGHSHWPYCNARITIGGMSKSWLRTPILLTSYRRYLENQDAVGFVRAVMKSYVPSTLERLGTSVDCETRRAAVLALGFTGDYTANHALGRAMQDEDSGVRQLAAIACRSVWNRFGDKSQRRQLADTVRLNATRRYRDAGRKCFVTAGVRS